MSLKRLNEYFDDLEPKWVIVPHSKDFDGKASGAIVRQWCRANDKKFINIPYNYGYKFPWAKVAKHDTVIMSDVSLPLEDMIRMKKSCARFIFIDHHISKFKELKEAGFETEGLLDNNSSGCGLTWKFLYPGTPSPIGILLLEKYDIWQWQGTPGSREFQYGLRCHDTEEDEDTTWGRILKDDKGFIQSVIDEGALILKYQGLMNAESMKSSAFDVQFEGLRFIAANSSGCGSELFNSVYDQSKHDAMIVFSLKRVDGAIEWVFGMYSDKDEVDVSKIATRYGGGGHKLAAGMQCKTLPFELPTNMKPLQS